MTRLEILTFRFLDEGLNREEAEELERLLTQDGEAQERFIGLCETEGVLRGHLGTVDVAGRVMEEIRSRIVSGAPSGASDGEGGASRADSFAGGFFRLWMRAAAVFVLLSALGGALLTKLYLDRRASLREAVLAQLSQVEGEVALIRDGTPTIHARKNDALREGDTIDVSPSALAEMLCPDGTRLVLGADSRAVLRRPSALATAGSRLLELQKGTLTAHVRKQQHGQSLAVHTPNARVTVRGTRFLVKAEADATRLDVIEGEVALKRTTDGASVAVSKGHFAVATPADELSSLPLPPRITVGLVGLYRFAEGAGDVIRDVSGVEQPLDLRIETPRAVSWVAGGGLRFVEPAAFAASETGAAKIFSACRQNNELTIEAWVTPAKWDQMGPARIVTVSGDTSLRNFTLGQGGGPERWPPKEGTAFLARLRTTDTGNNGVPALETGVGSAVTDLTHVVFTRARSGATILYIDGAVRAKGHVAGDFSGWDAGFRLALGDEFTHDRPWVGTYHLVAIYSRALDRAEILTNFRAGVPGSAEHREARR